MLKIGTKAPEFTAVSTDKDKVSFPQDYKGRYVILIFYCRNNTPG